MERAEPFRGVRLPRIEVILRSIRLQKKAKVFTRASELFSRQGFSMALERLYSDRSSQDLCIECGVNDRFGCEDCCAECLAHFPRCTEIGTPYDAWMYQVIQFRPATGFESAFRAERRPILERRGQKQVLGLFETFEAAEKACRQKLKRAQSTGW
jgi:hypothetical protein